MKDEIYITLAGKTFSCRLLFSETAKYFKYFQIPDPGAPCVGAGSVCMTEKDWQFFLDSGADEDAHSEYSLLCFNMSDALLPYDRVLIHAVAIRWRDRAYLICAGSGTGKSTQARTLQELRPGEFSVICGDRPALEFCRAVSDDNCSKRITPADSAAKTTSVCPPSGPPADAKWEIIIHPSPWNGKENWYGADAAPLAGLILLERGETNKIVSISPKEAALSMYTHFIQTAWEADGIRKVAELENRLLQTVPIWKLTTHHVPDSTELLLEAVFSE